MPTPTTFAPLPPADPVFRRAHGVGADTPHSELPTRLDTGSAAADAAARADAEPAGCLPPGTKLRQFVIERVLGEGGFGVVYSAYDLALGRRVAIKEYMPAAFAVRRADFSVQVRSSSEKQAAFAIGLKSFVNEARLLAQLDHPALAKVFQFWSERGTAYFVMPYYTSPTLAGWLRARWGGSPQNAPVDEAWLQRYLLGALDALSFLHGRSCLHRDLSPQNLLVVNDADPLLLDFGAARRVVGAHTASLTAILKPGYAPLEQYDGNTLKQGPWTDLYALAAVMYHAMVGAPPPAAVERVVQASGRSNAPGTATSIQTALAATCYSRPFIAAIELALALHPRHRPQSAEELVSLIRLPSAAPAAARPATVAVTRPPTLARSRIPTLNVPLPMAPLPSNAPVNIATTAVPARSPRKAGALALAAAAIVAISAAGLTILALTSGEPPTSGEPLPSVESAIAAEAPRSSRTAATDPALELPAKPIGSAMSESVSVLDEGRAPPSTVGESTTPIRATSALPAARDVSVPAAGERKTATAIAPAPVQARAVGTKTAESRATAKPQTENRKSNDGASSAPKAAAPAAAPMLPPLLTAYSPAAEAPRPPTPATSEPQTNTPPAPAERDILRALARPTPAYPAEALRDGIRNGRVLASFVVNPDGSVSGIQIVSAAPARAFDRAVRSALAQWRFAPVAAATPASVEFAFDVSR